MARYKYYLLAYLSVTVSTRFVIVREGIRPVKVPYDNSSQQWRHIAQFSVERIFSSQYWMKLWLMCTSSTVATLSSQVLLNRICQYSSLCCIEWFSFTAHDVLLLISN